MARRITRTITQLAIAGIGAFFMVWFLDSRYRVLPTSLHNALPAHHPGLVVVDISVATCSSVNVLSNCKLDPAVWHRVDKDLYLGHGWVSSAYIHIKRKKEEDLLPEDKVVVDVSVGKLTPSIDENKEKTDDTEKWEKRDGGIWIKRTGKTGASDSDRAVTSVDVLFGADASDPRNGWEVIGTPLLLGSSGEKHEPRLSIRRGNPEAASKPVLKIRDNGTFKILQVSDLHLSTGTGVCRDEEPKGLNQGKCEADPRTLEFIGRLLDEESKPDLVVLSGDQVNGDTAPDAQTAIFKYAQLFTERKIPFATIFGNHDDEGSSSMSRAEQMDLVESLPYSLSQAGPPEIDGVGNYYLEVLGQGSSGHSALTIYLLDTHAYSPDEKKYHGYDWLKKNQIDWFKETARGLKKAHDGYSHIHMNLAFIHIPLPEYAITTNSRKGEFREAVTAPKYNSHFRDALVDEGVVMVSCGHDHANEYCALSRHENDLPALWMCYAGGSGFGGYGGYGGYHRRVRFFEIDVNEGRILTYKRVEYGDVKKRIDEQIIVESGKPVELVESS